MKLADLKTTQLPSLIYTDPSRPSAYPPVVLVHGFGGAADDWTADDQVQDVTAAPPLEGATLHPWPPIIPFKIGTAPKVTLSAGLFETLEQAGCRCVTWTQTNSQGDIPATARELGRVVAAARSDYGSDQVILVAHSRGGLVCRTYIMEHFQETGQVDVMRLVTLGSPHSGTALALVDDQLLKQVIPARLPKWAQPLITVLLKRLVDLAEGKFPSAEQLEVDSSLIQTLNQFGFRPEIDYVFIAGTQPALSKFYGASYQASSYLPRPWQNPPFRWEPAPWETLVTLSSDLASALSRAVGLPLNEMREEKGDGLVAADSALALSLNLPEQCRVIRAGFPVNHTRLRSDPVAMQTVVAAILGQPLPPEGIAAANRLQASVRRQASRAVRRPAAV